MTTDILHIIFNVIAPVAVCAAVGFVWEKRALPFDTAMVTRLVSNIGVPCLVFATMAQVDLSHTALVTMGGAALLTTGGFLIVGAAILRFIGLPLRTFLNPIAFANTGNMGLPLVLLAFGEDGLALGIAYFVVNVLLLMTVGIAVAAASFDPRDLIHQPFIYAAIASVAVLFGGVVVPNVVVTTTALLGDFTIPLMLITLGVSLAKLRVSGLRRTFLICGLRFGLGLAGGFGVVALLGLEGVSAGTVIVMCAMPVAVISFLMAERYGGDSQAVAGAVVVSTFISAGILPILLWVLMG